MSREAVVAASRIYLGTPYLHQGRVGGPKGGIDCVGLGVCVAWDVGAKPRSWDIRGYRRLPDGVSLMRLLGVHMGQPHVDQDVLQPGDLIVLAWDRFPHHVGILGDYAHGGLSLIHANNVTGRVDEQRLVFQDNARFVAAFKFPGVV
jgi:cell wall-associated NlpC family hydrolase